MNPLWREFPSSITTALSSSINSYDQGNASPIIVLGSVVYEKKICAMVSRCAISTNLPCSFLFDAQRPVSSMYKRKSPSSSRGGSSSDTPSRTILKSVSRATPFSEWLLMTVAGFAIIASTSANEGYGEVRSTARTCSNEEARTENSRQTRSRCRHSRRRAFLCDDFSLIIDRLRILMPCA